MPLQKQILSCYLFLDTGASEDWITASVDSLKNLWAEAKQKQYVSISPLHIQPIFDPDPECTPQGVQMVVRAWIEVKV